MAMAVEEEEVPLAAGGADLCACIKRWNEDEGPIYHRTADHVSRCDYEAESALSEAGMAPDNGWIADYPVTPDIAGELEASVAVAAETGILSLTKDAAVEAFRDVIAEYNLPAESHPVSQEAAARGSYGGSAGRGWHG